MAKKKKKAGRGALTTRSRPKARASARAKAPARGKRAAKRPATRRSRPARRTGALARERARLEGNKQLVLAFYAKMIGEKDPEAARAYMGERYVQHSPYAQDGFEGVAAFARAFKRDFPAHRYEVKRVIAEGDYVVVHLHGMNGPNPHGEAVIDIFRVDGDRVVEHWDVIQPLPEKSNNPNTPF